MANDMDTLAIRLGRVFQPASPIDNQELFIGREGQIRSVIDAINQRGMHVVIYGEPGVGKTSLGKILQQKLKAVDPMPIGSPLVTCVSTDTYESIWRNMFDALDDLEYGSSRDHYEGEDPVFSLPKPITPTDVHRRLNACGENRILYVIFDEFNKIEDEESRRLFADTIKLLSDRGTRATVIMIGVADDVVGLIDDHQSVERCLAQIPMPRMPKRELQQIIVSGFRKVMMEVEEAVVSEISFLSKGLPHYTHLLSLYAGRAATDSASMTVNDDHTEAAIKAAIRTVQASIRCDYDDAVSSSRQTLHEKVLLACSMADTDSFGRFSPKDVCAPLRKIVGTPMGTDRFASHLKAFCESKRGMVLLRTGGEYRWKYRFRNPLMQPFVMLSGIAKNLIQQDDLKQYEDANGQRLFWPP